MSLGAAEDFTADEHAILASLREDDEGDATGNTPALETPTDPPASAPTPTPAADPGAAPAAAPAPAQPTAAAPAAPAAPPAPDDKPQGDLRAALRAARRAEHRSREEANRLREEVEALRKQVSTTPNPDDLSDEEIAQLEAEFPAAAKAARMAKRAFAQPPAAAPAAAPAAPEFVPAALPPEVQDAVDAVPDLLAWQNNADQSAFQLAIQFDGLLRSTPKWANASLEERFQEVARRVRSELGTPSPAPAPTPAPAPPAQPDPKAALAAVPRHTPQTLSDIGAGTGGPTDTLTLERMQRMSDDDIVAALLAGD